MPSAPARPALVRAFRRAATAVSAALPGRLAALVPPSLVAFGAVSGCTFAIDLALLTVLHSVLLVPLPIAVSLAYGVALTLNFLLNRLLTFESRRRLGPAAWRFTAVVTANYLVVVLGVTTGLDALGVQYHLARVAAGLAEGVFLYCAQRWFVFGDHRGDAGSQGEETAPDPAPAPAPEAGRSRTRSR